MKRIMFIACLILQLTIMLSINCYGLQLGNNPKESITQLHRLDDVTKEEIYKEIFITLLYPNIEKALADYYKASANEHINKDPWNVKIKNIDISQDENYAFSIKFLILSYAKSHNFVGEDNITFLVSLRGTKLSKFEHLKAYPITPKHQEIMKKSLPIQINEW